MDADEKWLYELYRAYQKDRDGIDYQYYRPIIEKAHELLDVDEPHRVATSDTVEAGIRKVLLIADEMYPEKDYPSVTKTPPVGLDWFERFRLMTKRVAKNLLSSWYGPLGAMAMVLLVMVSVQFTPSTPVSEIALQEQLDTMTNELRVNDLADEIASLNSWQYGFAARESDFGKAFSSGVLVTDLASINPLRYQDTELREALIANLTNQSGIAVNQILDNDNSRIDLLNEKLNSQFSDQGLSMPYLLGRWVEATYLKTRLLENERKAGQQLQGEIKSQIVSLGAVDNLIETLGLEENDNPTLVKELLSLKDHGHNVMTKKSIELLSQHLLKLRTLLMVQAQ